MPKPLPRTTTKYDGRGACSLAPPWSWLLGHRRCPTIRPDRPDSAASPAGRMASTSSFLYDDDWTRWCWVGTMLPEPPRSIGSHRRRPSRTAINQTRRHHRQWCAASSFDADATGSARVSVSTQKAKFRFSISDAAAARVMSGMLDDSSGPDHLELQRPRPNRIHLRLYGTVLVSQSVNAIAISAKRPQPMAPTHHSQKHRHFGQCITSYEYDAAETKLKVRDPNNVGQD